MSGIKPGPSDPAQEPQAVAWRWQEPGWGDHWVYNPDPSWLEQQDDIIKQPLYTRPVSVLEAKDAEIASKDEVLTEQARATYYWMKRATAAESRITSLERQLAEERNPVIAATRRGAK